MRRGARSISPAAVSAGSNDPGVVRSSTQAVIAEAVAKLGYVRGGSTGVLAAGEFRHLAVPAGDDRMIPWEGPATSASGADSGRAVASCAGAGSRRAGPRRCQLATDRASAVAHPSHPGEELGYPPEAVRRTDGSFRRLGPGRYTHVTATMLEARVVVAPVTGRGA
jgi:hypothetical protein